MKQYTESQNGAQYFTISEISRKIQRDIAYLRKNLAIITEEYEKKLVGDIERFLIDNIVREIRLSLYDPVQNNRVFMEYCYKVEPFSSYSSEGKWDTHVKIRALPETCLFDIFIYFARKFADLQPEIQKELLLNYNLDWYDINFNLRYNKKDKRMKTGTICSTDSSVNRYIYESPVEENMGIRSKSNFAKEQEASTEIVNGGKADKLDAFEEKIKEAMQGNEKCNYVIYKNMESAVASITHVLHRHNKIPIRWSLSRGFTIDNLSESYEVGDISHKHNTRNPATALNFIINNREERVSYIFEDFHHHIGGTSAINTAVAEIRSIIRDLARNLRERNEYVFFLSPSDFLPVELVPIFNLLKQETGKDITFLSKYGYDMTDVAFCRKNKPLIGREDQIKRTIQILCQMETNNPLLVGEAGVGKTALIEGLASEIIKGAVPPVLKGKKLFSLNLNTLVAGSRYRGDFEERINRLMEEVKSHSRELIVFIDEIHTLVGAGSAEGAAGAEDILKPALARGDFPCIGATTLDGYQSLLRDPALARRFQKVDIPPASIKEAENILYGIKHVFEKHHNVKISDDVIKVAVKAGKECKNNQALPGLAVRLLDSASAFVKMDGRHVVSPKDIEDEIKRSWN